METPERTERPRRARSAVVLVCAAVLALAVIAGCSSKKSSDTETGDTTTTEEKEKPSTETTRERERTTTTRSGGSPGTALSDEADEEVDAADWSQTASAYRGRNGLKVAYRCGPNGTPGSVWGTGTYTDDSSVCSAAVHAGLITTTQGGRVVIEITPGQESYQGSTENGVTSSDYGAWGGSFEFLT